MNKIPIKLTSKDQCLNMFVWNFTSWCVFMIDVFVFVVVIENDSLHMSSVQITAAS